MRRGPVAVLHVLGGVTLVAVPPNIRVVCIPSADRAFAAAVDAALDALEIGSPRDLESQLHPWVPDAVVRTRDLSGERCPTWYAYRDGRFAAERDADWHRAPGTPWARFDATTGVILGANDAFTHLLAYGDEPVIGRPYRDFVHPDAAELADRVYGEIIAQGEVHSVVQLRSLDGTDATVEYVARFADGVVEAWYRTIAIAGVPPG